MSLLWTVHRKKVLIRPSASASELAEAITVLEAELAALKEAAKNHTLQKVPEQFQSVVWDRACSCIPIFQERISTAEVESRGIVRIRNERYFWCYSCQTLQAWC